MTEDTFKTKILCVDDEIDILELYRDIIDQYPQFVTVTYANPREAIEFFKKNNHEVALVISDYMMPGMNGFEFRKFIKEANANVPFVMVSAHVTREMALSGIELKVTNFYDKPVSQNEIEKILETEATARAEAIKESRQLESIFIDEANSIIDDIESLLLSLESDRNNPDALNLFFRAVHTLKGSSGVLDTDIIAKYTHRYEDIISNVRKDPSTFTDSVFETLLKGYDQLKNLIKMVPNRSIHQIELSEILKILSFEKPQNQDQSKKVTPDGTPPPPSAHSNQKVKDFIPVPITLLDDLASLSGEITVIRNMVNKLLRALEVKFSGEKDIQSLGELFDEMHKINSSIQNKITDLRKVPMSGILKPLTRILRDLSKETRKKYQLNLQGENLRIDNSLAQVSSNSLIHLVRNSADHGIESPQERLQAGKQESGTITIDCQEDRDHVVVTVSDDGKGLDLNRIKAKAIEKNLCTPSELALMTNNEIMELIFLPGFSTASVVTDISGRGVGMDMVRASVQAVGGRIQIQSELGKGSKFSLILPVPRSILIVNSLLFLLGQRQYAVAQDDIFRVLRLSHQEFNKHLLSASGGKVLKWQNNLYPFIHLRDILKTPSVASEHDTIDILILKGDSFCYAMQVDSILDIEEIVVKRIQECINFQSIYAGATFLGDGEVGLILDSGQIARLANISQKRSLSNKKPDVALSRPNEHPAGNDMDYILFKTGSKGIYGAPLNRVFRLESFDQSRIKHSGDKHVIIYRDTIMPLIGIDEILNYNAVLDKEVPKDTSTLVIQKGSHYIGIVVKELLDITKSTEKIDSNISDRPEILGSLKLEKQTVTIMNLSAISEKFFGPL